MERTSAKKNRSDPFWMSFFHNLRIASDQRRVKHLICFAPWHIDPDVSVIASYSPFKSTKLSGTKLPIYLTARYIHSNVRWKPHRESFLLKSYNLQPFSMLTIYKVNIENACKNHRLHVWLIPGSPVRPPVIRKAEADPKTPWVWWKNPPRVVG